MFGAATSAMLRCALRSGGAGDAAAAALPPVLATSAPSAWTSCSPACLGSAGYAPRQAAGIATTAAPRQQQPGQGEAGHRPAASVDFGFKEVPRSDKQSMVEQVFTSVASSYDIMNDLMSGGMHRLWKDRLVETLRPFPGHQHLDVAGGTGDVAFRVLRAIRRAELEARMRGRPAAPAASPGAAAGAGGAALATDPPAPGRVVVCDINPSMLAEGQRKAKAAPDLAGDTGLSFVEGNAESLPQFEDAQFDSYTVAFGIRNVTDRGAALSEAYRMLRPGGRFLCLEFSHVTQPGLREVYDAYSFAVIPAIGQLVARDGASYQYLVESIRKFPDQEAFAGMIEDAGFSAVTYESLMGGIVAIHSGFKLP